MLNIKHLTKTYGSKKAVDDLSLHIAPGEIYGFIGHNGAGKTITLKSCVGILQFDAGEILVNGTSVRKDPLTCKKLIAYIPDNPDMYEFMTGIKYLNFIADIFGIGAEERVQRINKYADMFELTASLAQPVSSYSHGMKQKLALISALIRFPLINTAVLPALFVASGISAGMAATKILAACCFGAREEDPDMHAMHQAEWPVMATEAFCLFMIAIALLSGNESAKLAFSAFTDGIWAVVFWVGAVGIGFGIPLIASLIAGKNTESKVSFYFAGTCAIAGMMCLRLFILYAGQMNTIV